MNNRELILKVEESFRAGDSISVNKIVWKTVCTFFMGEIVFKQLLDQGKIVESINNEFKFK
jgi:hypothetical protein